MAEAGDAQARPAGGEILGTRPAGGARAALHVDGRAPADPEPAAQSRPLERQLVV